MTKTARAALRLRGRGSEKWELTFDAKRASAALGSNVLAQFYRIFVGVDRILTLEHLVVLNHAHVKENSEAALRNLHHLVLLLAGAMYEIGDALQGLTSSKFGKTLQALPAWEPLNKMRTEWNKEPFAAKIRNGFSHHFGEPESYQAGIESGPETAVLESGNDDTLVGSRFVEPWDALFRGEAIADGEMSVFVEKTRDAHMTLSSLVFELFHQVLSGEGLVPDSSDVPPEVT